MKQKKSKKGEEDVAPIPNIIRNGMNSETRRILILIVLFLVGIISFLGIFNAGGLVGEALRNAFKYIFGFMYVVPPIVCIYFGIRLLKRKPFFPHIRLIFGGIMLVLTLLGLNLLSPVLPHKGGILGENIAELFIKLFGTLGAIITLSIGLIISFMLLLNTRPDFSLWNEKIQLFFAKLFNRGISFGKNSVHQLSLPTEEEVIDDYSDENLEIEVVKEKKVKKMADIKTEEVDEEIVEKVAPRRKESSSYVFPPISILSRDQGKPNTGDIKANANIIKRTLQNFGIEVEMDEITVGPTVTRYALKPAEGVKLSRIVSLQSDLALALAAHPIRIEAPIPGKSLVGIEIPNKSKSIIGFATLMSDDLFKKDPKPLLVALGKNISGKAKFANLAKMPHALIAGATGSGKSVTVHAIITSLLYRNSPDDLKFIFVDPKRVELTMYNGLPHLLTPVITDSKKTIMALKWAAKEMDRRYDILENSKVRDIASYHENIYGKRKNNEEVEKMPYIVIIIDELADIMQAYPRELESGIVRLAQMSRAVGIHLILSTQRPSVNVITGLIKANIPARVALQVASQIDSRTILDQPGAEKLLGAGDMLYTSGEMSSPERIQCAYITEGEVKNIVQFIKHNNDFVTDEINLSPGALGNTDGVFSANVDGNDDDDLYEDARATVIETGKASTSFLQRKLGIGYARAAKLIDMMEERGIVGPGNGSKPREVLEKSPTIESADYSA